jgi:YHS domain-containing protein
MTWLLRFLLFLAAFFLVRKVMNFLLGWGSPSSKGRRSGRRAENEKAIEGRMVKDPHCGMYVASSLALSLGSGEETVYFCSQDCKEAYLRSKQLRDQIHD